MAELYPDERDLEYFRDNPQQTRRWIAEHPWERGKSGKGVVTPFGHVITWCVSDQDWPDSFPWHCHTLAALGYKKFRDDERGMFGLFSVSPEGDVWIYTQTISPHHNDRIKNYIQHQTATTNGRVN